jgi:hypothetical protein
VNGIRTGLSTLAIVVACTGKTSGAGEGEWELGADSVRSEGEADVRAVPRLRVVGREGAEGAPQTEAVVLSFDCLPGHPISTIMTDQKLRQGSVDATLTLDAGQPHTLPGFAGTTPSGGQLVFTISQDSMLALLRGHQRATIEYSDGAGSSRSTAVFSVAGLDKYLAQFQATCAGGKNQPQ